MINALDRSLISLPLLGGIICLVLEAIFVYFRVPFWSFPLFLLGFYLIVYIPGRLVLLWLKLTITPLERFTLELGSGYLLSTLFYFICRALKIEFAFILLVAALLIFYLYRLIRKEPPWPAFKLQLDFSTLGFLLLLALVLLSCALVNFDSWVFQPDGSMTIRSLHNRDVFFHVALVHELAFNFFPNIPYAGNFPFAYHFFPELLASFFVRWGNLTPWDLVVRYLPVFHFTLLFLGAFILMRKLTKNYWASLFGVFLINFMGNMGFIYRYFAPYLDHPHWEGYFVPHTLILHINPLQMALTVLLLGFFCLSHYLENGRLQWLLLTALFLGLVSFYKVFTALQVLIGMGIPALILVGKRKDWRLFTASFSAGVIMAAVVLFLWLSSPFSGKFIELKPLFLVFYNQRLMLSSLEQFKFTYEKFYRLMFYGGVGNFLYYFVWMGLLFLLGSLGLRVIGLKKWLGDLLTSAEKPTWSVIAYTILTGILLSLLITIPTEDYNTIIFITISVYLMSIYAAAELFRWLENYSYVTKSAVIALFILLSIPTTINLLAARPSEINAPPQIVRLAQYVKKNIKPGSIIAHPYKAILYLLLPPLGGVRTMAELVFPIENLLGKETTTRLRKDNMNIYKTNDPQELKNILINNNVDYVIEDEQEQILCEKKGIMTEIYHRDGYVINEVIR